MTKCLFKALKAVDLDKYLGLFRSLGYESAGALAHFRADDFPKLNFTEQELLRLIALLDVLKDATREGKVCPHYLHSSQTKTKKSSVPIRASWNDETVPITTKRSISSMSANQRSTMKNSLYESFPQRSSTVLSRQHPITPSKIINQRILGPKSFLNRPAVQHVRVKSYNYGVPTTRRPRNSFFVSSPRRSHDAISYAKPAEIYVYARKRPLLQTEMNFQDVITVPDNKRVIITENKANLDCSPLLKKTEFQFDHVFGSDVSNREVFESTVLPFISPEQRHNLTYICFGQTGSGKSHTIFGSKNTDGLLVLCTQLLLKESLFSENTLVCSFYEIYNNQVYDLVNAGKRLFVREDGGHHVNVIGTTEFVINSLEDLHCVIDEGLNRRHHGKSAFNSNSSRSHAVFQIFLKNNYDASESFRLIFIDLAGSERATDAQNNQRQTRREGAQINCSLLALKECIRSMDLTHTHAPFRQSKLTHILRDSLVGSTTRTCLMANVSPADDCCQCSLNTFQYASRIRDISIRHRHRSMPVNTNHFEEQKTFKPKTSSTPVHRLLSNHMEKISDDETAWQKPLDVNWQIDDNDNDGLLNRSNLRHAKSQKTTTTANREQTPSSYFPQPQADIKQSKKQSNTTSQLLCANGNERQWKAVPAPTTNSTRMIPVAPIHLSDDNPYSSATGTESLGTKISKAATNGLNNRQSDTGAMTSDTEPMIYTNSKQSSKDPIEFFNNRDELLSIVSSRLTPVSKRSSSATTPRQSRINSPKSKQPINNKTRSKTRPIKSSSSTSTSLANLSQEKKPIEKKKLKTPSSIHFQKFDVNIRRSSNRYQQRTGPLRVPYSSDSEEQEKIQETIHRRKTPTFKRSEVCQTISNQLTNPSKATFEQVHSPTRNINNSWPISSIFSSPSKDFGVRVSDQLNALRSLLENRLNEPEEIKFEKKKISSSSILQTSPGTFTRDFLQSIRQSNSDDDKEVERNFSPFNSQDKSKIYDNDMISSSTTTTTNNNPRQAYLSSFSDELNHARVSSSATSASSSTIGSNLAAKLDTQEQRNLSSQGEDIHSHSHQKGLTTSESDHQLLNETSSDNSTSSKSLSPITLPVFRSLNSKDHNHFSENETSSPLLAGTSFDALLNSLKTIREKDLDFVVRNTDDKLISVAD